MMYFGNKCKCNCEITASRVELLSDRLISRNKSYDERINIVQDKLIEVLVGAGLLVESEKKKENAIYYMNKRYVIKEVK